ncbi:hypothetical protein EDD11_005382 [Mortierella claussenii]|nr:hypothetical protein EDD11_005382 [Mortierella claussenii]
MNTYNEDRTLEFAMSTGPAVEMSGGQAYMVLRSDFYNLLQSRVPSEKIQLGKRVLSIQQNEHGVRIQFSDGSSADGDILVGADGAYSGVRQSLYQQLKKKDKLPTSDAGSLPFRCVRLTGQTNSLDPAKYPELLEDSCRFTSVLGKDKPCSWLTITMKNNIYCWGVNLYLDEESFKEHDSFRNSEWGPEKAEAMCKQVRDFPVPGGVNNSMTLGDLIDATPLVSKVMLEEKIFETWYSGRTVLLGDACHKIHPASGAGAANAIHDAAALANWISVLDSTAIEDTEAIFKEYYEERYPAALNSFNAGRRLSKVNGSDLTAKIIRFITRNMPLWLHKLSLKSAVVYRPQVSFLPLVKDVGTFPASYQASLEKTLAIRKAKEQQQQSTQAISV